jgi:hypothetical protein
VYPETAFFFFSFFMAFPNPNAAASKSGNGMADTSAEVQPNFRSG